MAEVSESDERKHATKMEKVWSLRKKEKRLYDDAIGDDEIVGKRTFNLDEKLRQAQEPGQKFYVEMKGPDVTLKYFQQNGFSCPIMVREKSGLGMRMPSTNFTVADVKRCVGSFRLLDVVDVTTQQDLVMTVKDWVHYYENAERDRLLNVISLEFSHTRLEDYVDQPEVIHQMDWVDLAWPWYHKEFQTEPTNLVEKMMYPKVQNCTAHKISQTGEPESQWPGEEERYCLMSVQGCYTDFHIDMGGTSVWYHILKGRKLFWLIPPTEDNLQLYENWTLSAKQGDIFFGDLVSNCYHIHLEAGHTFFIPPGWIHAVYTPEDSLVFGGNFLHSFNVVTQLRVWDIETKTHVPPKFRYPFFIDIHWYVLERYVSCLAGKRHRVRSIEEECLYNGVEDEGVHEHQSQGLEVASKTLRLPDSCSVSLSLGCNDESLFDSDVERSQTSSESTWVSSVNDSLTSITGKHLQVRPWLNLTPYELEGLWAVVRWLEGLPQQRRSIPKDIPNAELLLSDAKALLKLHRLDDHSESVTGSAVLQWPKTSKRTKMKKHHPKMSSSSHSSKKSETGGAASSGQMWHYRRIRCKQCEPCTRSECGECLNCRDMKKFGGPGCRKQTCISRRCLAPLLPHHAVCQKCGEGDGGKRDEASDDVILDDLSLMECRICCNVFHPKCLKELNPQLTHSGVVDEDLPNSWECAKCCEAGKEGQGKQRTLQKSTSISSSHQERRRRVSTNTSSPPLLEPAFAPPAASEDEVSDEEDAMEADFSQMDNNRQTTKCNKRKKSQLVSAQVCGWRMPKVCLEKLPDSNLHCELRSPAEPTKHRKTQPKTTFSLISSDSSSSSSSSSPILSARMTSRGREITVPRRFLP